ANIGSGPGAVKTKFFRRLTHAPHAMIVLASRWRVAFPPPEINAKLSFPSPTPSSRPTTFANTTRTWRRPWGRGGATGPPRGLPHVPGVARPQQLGHVALALLRDDLAELLVHARLVGRLVHPAQHAQGRRESRRRVHAGEEEGVGGVGMPLVVHDEVRLAHSLAEGHDLELDALHADALVALVAEDERLAVLEGDGVIVAHFLLRQALPGPIVEDV